MFEDRKIFFSADHHFGHSNIIKYCSRPFQNVWEMNNVLTENWNSIVGPEDLVYHLGDFSFQSDRYRQYLNGHIILIKGNHDKKRYDYSFDEVVSQAELKIGEFNCILTHIPIEINRIYKKNFVPDLSLLDRYDWIICGHVHQNWKINGKNINVGVDVWEFRPIELNNLLLFLKEQKEKLT